MLESILRRAIRHRALVVLLTIAVAIVGAFALARLPIDAVPDVTNNQVQITTLVDALGPGEIERQVTYPIETALAGIDGLEYTRSLSRNGFSQVTAVFEDGLNIYFARQQVSERLLEVRELLPEGAEPGMGPIATGLGEVYMYAVDYEQDPHPVEREGAPGFQKDGTYITPEGERLTTELERSAYLRTVQDWIIAPQIKGIAGVAGVDVVGGYTKQYHVQPDPAKLASFGLSLHDVVEAIDRNNVGLGAAYVEDSDESYAVRADGRARSVSDLAGIAVGERDGTPIRLHQVAEIGVGKELRTGSASENGREVVVGTALMRLGENSRTVAAAVGVKMDEVRRSLPPGVEARPLLDRKSLVDATIHTVTKNLAEGAALVIIVLFLMLGNFRAALITALAIPLAMLIAAIGMVKIGISGNLLSLGAIDFGIVVDGAVIIVENCLRHLGHEQARLGRLLTLKERLHTVFEATKEVREATMFGEAIIVVVFLPILTLTGIEGKMFQPLAATFILALLGAFILSITFVPAAVAIIVKGRVAEKENWLVLGAQRVYAPVLEFGIRFRLPVVLGALAILLSSGVLFARLGQEFMPTLDEGNVAMQSLRIPSTSLTRSTAMQLEVEKEIVQLPEVELMFSKTGTAEVAFDPMPPSISDGFIVLSPREKWPDPTLTRTEIQAKIEAAVAKLPGQNYESSQPIQLRFNELLAGVRGDIAIKIFGDDFDKLLPVASQIATILGTVPGSDAIRVEQVEGLPIMSIDVKREVTARYGLSVADVQDVVAIAIGGREAGEVFEGDRRFDVIVRLPERLRNNLEAISDLPVPVNAHDESPLFVPLSSLADVRITEGPNQISRENGKRRVVVTANVRDRDLGSFVEETRTRIASEVTLPAGSWIDYGGAFENLQAARKRLSIVVPVCFMLIFILLFSTFHSAKYALLVFTGVPLALTGGVAALWLRGMPFSISAAVGFIALSGVAVLNGLVMVSHINRLRRGGMDVDTAVRQGSTTRLRPVLMTALVASLGFVPMAIASGRGAEVQKPIATVVIGGIVTSTLLTLVVLPALYRLWHRKDETLADEQEEEESFELETPAH